MTESARGVGSVLVWAGILILWSALVVSCIVLLGRGAYLTVYFEPTGEALAEARTGNLLILGGSLGLFIAAVWARLMRVPLWACILVALPAALVGGLTVFVGASLFPARPGESLRHRGTGSADRLTLFGSAG